MEKKMTGQYKYMLIGGNQAGFYSNFFKVIQNINQAEAEGLIPFVVWLGGMYGCVKEHAGIKSENVWDYFFEPISDVPIKKLFPKIKMGSYGNTIFDYPNVFYAKKGRMSQIEGEPDKLWEPGLPPAVCLNNMSYEMRVYINNIIKKYIKVKQYIIDKVDAFYNRHMKGSYVIGVHLRLCHGGWHPTTLGVDPIKHCKISIKKCIEEAPDAKIYVTADNNNSIKQIRKEFGERVFFKKDITQRDRNESYRLFNKSRKQHSVCMRDKKFFIGPLPAEEVLVESLLLSKCNVFVKGVSNVAVGVGCWNPDLKVIHYPHYTPECYTKDHLHEGPA